MKQHRAKSSQYVTYTNKSLLNLEKASLGYDIGVQFVGCPTCGDDMALVHLNIIDISVSRLNKISVSHATLLGSKVYPVQGGVHLQNYTQSTDLFTQKFIHVYNVYYMSWRENKCV